MLVPVLSTALAVPFADGNAAMFADADAAYPAGPVIGSGPNRLDPVVIASRMQEVLDRLASGGCTTTALEYQAHVAGAYLNGSVVGMSDTTTATGTVDGTLRQFRATLAGEGEIGSVFSTFDSGRLVADLDAGGFVVGRFIRVNGRRGIFVAAMGSCDGGATAAEALASWYEGDLSGWTTWDGPRVFTPCGAVGAFGPSQEACDSHYIGTLLGGEVTVVGGLQHWTAPFDGTYRIEAFGAQGASGSGGVDGYVGGRGARMRGDFPLLAGDTLVIGVGQMGTRYVCNGSGGGASFVTTGGGAPLLVAGGGGGVRESVLQNGCDAQPMEMGGTASGNAQTHGCGLQAASTTGDGGLVSLPGWGSGGGAMFQGGQGEYGVGALGGQSLAGSAIGGYHPFDDAAHGGFGGGGSGNGNCGGGGGGGYSGGDGGRVAGAGGSFNSGGNPSNSGGDRSGDGLVTIDRL